MSDYDIDIGLALSNLQGDIKQMKRDFDVASKAIEKEFEQASKAMEKDFEKAFKEMEKDSNRVTKEIIQDQNKIAKGSSGATSSMIKNIGGVVAGYMTVQTVLRGTTEAIKKMVSETGALETATVKWEVLTGSVREADQIIRDIFEFSNSTPYTFKGVEKASSTLYTLTDGALQGTEALRQLGDRSAKANAPIEELSIWWGRMYSNMQSGRPIGEAMARMQELGVVSGSLRNKIEALSKEEMMNGTGWKTFIEGTAGANGMMERLSQTIEGKISTLKGVWDGVFAIEDKELQKQVSDTIQVLIDTLNSNKGTIQNVLTDVFGVLSDFVQEWIDGATKIYNLFKGSDETSDTIAGVKSGAITKTDVMNEISGLNRDLATGNRSGLMDQIGDIAKEVGLTSPELAGIYGSILDVDKNQLSIYKSTLPKMTEAIDALVILQEKRNRMSELQKIDELDLYKKARIEPTTKAVGAGGSGSVVPVEIVNGVGDYSSLGSMLNPALDGSFSGDGMFKDSKDPFALGGVGSFEAGDIMTKIETYFGSTTDLMRSNGQKNNETIKRQTIVGFNSMESMLDVWGDTSLNMFEKWSSSTQSLFRTLVSNGDMFGLDGGTLSTIGLLSAGVGLLGGAVDFFSGADDDSSSKNASSSPGSTESADATILSKGFRDLHVTNAVEINTNMISTDHSFDIFFDDYFAPKITDLMEGAVTRGG